MRLRLALVIAALSGFIALSYEIVWYRVISTMTRGIASSFGLLLAAYLFGLAIGSRASGAFRRGPAGDARQLRVLARFVALAKRGTPRATFAPAAGAERKQAEQAYQRGEIERSLNYCRETLNLGT